MGKHNIIELCVWLSDLQKGISTMSRIWLSLIILFTNVSLICAPVYAYSPTIPEGYSSKVILKVDYGDTPDKIGVEWGNIGGAHNPKLEEYIQPTSISGMAVVGDKVYLIDSKMGRVKKFASRGKLIWQSERLKADYLGNTWITVSPDGECYVSDGGGEFDTILRISKDGKTIWRKTFHQIFDKRPKDIGFKLDPSDGIDHIEWTPLGLTVTAHVRERDANKGQLYEKAFLLSKDGKVTRALPGFFVGTDSTIYSYEGSNRASERIDIPVIGRNLDGRVVSKTYLDFGTRRETILKEIMTISVITSNPGGGFIVYGWNTLSHRVPTVGGRDTKGEEVLWRFDSKGKLKEEWRFLSSPFWAHNTDMLSGGDGSIYHLQYSEKGISVIKYYRTDKKK